ncbi:BON domain-containing protein [Maridesulfovibrio sp.]|uniref:BON domain-containing protein n=1 Tax=Maridesulfovibrio sp. TaxID=2795000 RepID=UPI002A18E30A|nr:BON domain-containing protein [Maridesulfovibrio sp.]
MRSKLYMLFTLLTLCFMSGCSAGVLIPPLPGPMMIPSSVGTAINAYSIGTDERGFQTIIEDEMLETTIQAAILEEAGLEIMDLSTYSYNGHVYIVGRYDEKQDIQRIRKIVKNSGKANSLTTYLFADRGDAECNSATDYMLQMEVKAALLDDPSVWGTNFAVKSVGCNIILLGRVGNINEAVAAKQIAARIKGVRSVKSFIRATHQNRYSNQERRIAAALE